jgi:hypothetical protein
MLQGDLSKKLTKGVKSMDFRVRECNCRRGGRGEGKCQCRGICRVPIFIYKITCCKMTNKIYIRNTQQHFKIKMRAHFQDVKKLMEKVVRSDSYARQASDLEGLQQQHQEYSAMPLTVRSSGRAT